MNFDSIIRARHSTRSFKSKKAPFEDILEAIDSALQGPFAGNMNNLKFLIIENEKTIKILAKQADQPLVSEAPVIIIVCADETNLVNQYGERGKDYSKQQAGAAINTILLKLTELGLSSCWVGAFSYEVIKEILKIPDHIHIEALIPVGYERGKAKKPRKYALENVLRWEDWTTKKRQSLILSK